MLNFNASNNRKSKTVFKLISFLTKHWALTLCVVSLKSIQRLLVLVLGITK